MGKLAFKLKNALRLVSHKWWLHTGGKSWIRERVKHHDAAFSVFNQSERIIHDQWPKYHTLRRQAAAMMKQRGKEELIQKLVDDMMFGRVRWLPQEKRGAALLYAQLAIAGIEVDREKLFSIGLTNREINGVEALVKLY